LHPLPALFVFSEEDSLKNPAAKTVDREHAYEVWQSHDGSWTWYVLKKWQADDDKKFARWFCDVVTPMVPEGEMGDVYVSEIKANARRIK
jgi:hypothetical protein